MASTVLGFAAPGGAGLMITIGYMAVFFGIMWFLVIRPQKKREKEVAQMQQSIKIGDQVLLQDGIYGKVVDIINDLFIIELGLNKSVRIPVKKVAVAGVQAPNLTIGKKAEEEDPNVEYEYVEVEVEVDENGNEIVR
ncbi:preprotein translocase subunit YajC [Sporanaerobium hydrogeniformans]|uniref:Preprotein translocase subunit YajC n=1 Tax=Sporanaerobium hydrogeniformans TaxID=3072179 RepID=A0AC61DGR6_9FIRM|nr:preprotein translocase subunit YajC [Sporanaerobium hydrogeniformans]PHV72065.1 preprotein translocase subunit YajC [Sporanaerobium hydrogeniformans]